LEYGICSGFSSVPFTKLFLIENVLKADCNKGMKKMAAIQLTEVTPLYPLYYFLYYRLLQDPQKCITT